MIILDQSMCQKGRFSKLRSHILVNSMRHEPSQSKIKPKVLCKYLHVYSTVTIFLAKCQSYGSTVLRWIILKNNFIIFALQLKRIDSLVI